MKKLLFGLIATVMFGFVGNAQSFQKTRTQNRIFQYISVIAYLESKTEFKSSTSPESFVQIFSKGVKNENLKKEMTPFLTNVYNMHKSGYTQDDAYDKADLTLLYTTYNNLGALMVKDPSIQNEYNQSRFNWGNLWRKVVQAIIDSFEPEPKP